MRTKNPFMDGKMTDRIKTISNFQEAEVLMWQSLSPEVIRTNAELFRQYLIDTGLLIHSAMEQILDLSEELVEEEFENFSCDNPQQEKSRDNSFQTMPE
ncbi:hypothetical protein [Endozoicomonas sp. 2B-B]